jgi:hypothetical protein
MSCSKIACRRKTRCSLGFGVGLSCVTERTTLALDYAGLANSDYSVSGVALRLDFRF